MDATINQLSDDDFEQNINNTDKTILVDYWAEWCAPCKMIEPQLQELSVEYSDRLQVYKINVDHNPITSQQYNIRGIPTLLIFRDGQVQGSRLGALSKVELKQFIDDHL